MVSFEKVKSIMDTLPIGYYLGHKIDLELENGMQSYHDPIDNKIVIGYQLLPDIKTDGISDDEMENNIRCMLYHEISHAILTPVEKVTDIINIFEDERIETLLSGFYHRVNFKKFIKKVNGHKGPKPPKTPREMFYDVVRYREGKEEYIKIVEDIIKEYASMNRRSSHGTWTRYVAEIENLYKQIKKEFESIEDNTEEPPDGMKEKGGNPDTETEEKKDTTKETDTKEPDTETEEEKEEPDEICDMPLKDLTEEEREAIRGIVKESIERILTRYDNSALTSKLSTIIENATRKKKYVAGAINGYSGTLDPKQVRKMGNQDNYKWWTKPTQNGNGNRYDKLHLNLFVDVSGSFCGSEIKINEMIKALAEVENKNKDFSFTLIKMGNTNRIAPKAERKVTCCEGNHLTNDIIEIYKKVQEHNSACYNLVVFDGDAQSFDLCPGHIREMREKHKKAWTAFNSKNCTIISDYENQRQFDKYSPSAKRIYTTNYTEELEQNIIKSLELLFR